MMNKSNSIEAIGRTDLSEQTNFDQMKQVRLKTIFMKRLIKGNYAVKN